MAGVLHGKTVLIVGGGRGIGRAAALACAAEGARLLVNDLGCDADGRGEDPSVAEAVADEIRAAGGEALANPLDVALAGNAAKLVHSCLERFGQLDALLCCAGMRQHGPIEYLRDADIERLWQVQVRSAVALTREASKAMAASSHGGSILLAASPLGVFGATRQAGWSMTSGALIGFGKAAATELRRQRIRVNVLAPTARTRLTEELPLFRSIPPGSLRPEEVAPLVVFLFSDAAATVSGEVLGAAGARLYALAGRESVGAFASHKDGWKAGDIAAAWQSIVG